VSALTSPAEYTGSETLAFHLVSEHGDHCALLAQSWRNDEQHYLDHYGPDQEDVDGRPGRRIFLHAPASRSFDENRIETVLEAAEREQRPGLLPA
jgi:hypothetical protein